MKRKIILFFWAFIMLWSSACFAQNSFSIRFGAAIPMDKFALVDKAEANKYDIEEIHWGLVNKKENGGANTGLTFGMQGKFGISAVEGLGVTVSLDGFYNGINSELKEYFDDYADECEEYDEDFSFISPKYINATPMAGLNYEYKINDNIAFNAGFGLGVNFRIITDFKMTYEGDGYDGGEEYSYSFEEKYSYDNATSFAYKLGFGVVLKERFLISLDYFALGGAEIKGRNSVEYTEDGYSESEKQKFKYGSINPKLLTLTAGIKF